MAPVVCIPNRRVRLRGTRSRPRWSQARRKRRPRIHTRQKRPSSTRTRRRRLSSKRSNSAHIPSSPGLSVKRCCLIRRALQNPFWRMPSLLTAREEQRENARTGTRSVCHIYQCRTAEQSMWTSSREVNASLAEGDDIGPATRSVQCNRAVRRAQGRARERHTCRFAGSPALFRLEGEDDSDE